MFTVVTEAEVVLARAEGDMANAESEKGLEEAQAELNRALSLEEQVWRQKAQVKWLNSGDRNTRYFQAVVTQRRVQGAIHRVKTSAGMWVEQDEYIAKEAVEYFFDLFSGSVDPNPRSFRHLIRPW